MRFDDYDTFIFKHPIISGCTINLAPIFSDLLGRFVCLVEKLFGTTEKTDNAVKSILQEKPNTAPTTPLDQSRISSSRDEDAKFPAPLKKKKRSTVFGKRNTTDANLSANPRQPVATSSTERPSVNDDNDDSTSRTIQTQSRATNSNKVSINDDNDIVETPEVPRDKNNLFRSFATAMGFDDYKEFKRILVEKGCEMLESIRGDLDEYYKRYQHPPEKKEDLKRLSGRSTLERLSLDNSHASIRTSDELLAIAPADLIIPEVSEKVNVLNRIHAELDQERKRINTLLKPYELLHDIYYWYSKSEDMRALESELEDKGKSVQSRFNKKTYGIVLALFSEGILSDSRANALYALSKIFDVTVHLSDVSWAIGNGKTEIHLNRDNGQYSLPEDDVES